MLISVSKQFFLHLNLKVDMNFFVNSNLYLNTYYYNLHSDGVPLAALFTVCLIFKFLT
jgi:hypothetical protein